MYMILVAAIVAGQMTTSSLLTNPTTLASCNQSLTTVARSDGYTLKTQTNGALSMTKKHPNYTALVSCVKIK